jgi:HSP20 family protein
MAKEKRSFFERLTGAVNVPEDDFEDDTPVANKKEEWVEDAEGELPVDVYQTPTEIVVKTLVAGVRPDDLDISITRDMVIIKGKREESRSVETDDFFHRELYWGSFSRTIVLPQEIEVEEAEAIEKHGLLIIRLPKIDKNRQTKLKIKSN